MPVRHREASCRHHWVMSSPEQGVAVGACCNCGKRKLIAISPVDEMDSPTRSTVELGLLSQEALLELQGSDDLYGWVR